MTLLSKMPEAHDLPSGGDEIPIYTRHGLELPLRESPIRFAVTMKNGLTSNTWGLKVEKDGDAYIFCRDNMKEQKISLHKSGKQHIAFSKGSGHEMTPGSRYWNQWREPQQQRPPMPSFKLVFPSWATTVNGEAREGCRSKWDSNQILIEGDDELITVVLFFIIDEGLVPRQQGLPSIPIAVVPLRPGKDLCVIACREHDRGLKSMVERTLQRIDFIEALPPEEIYERVLSVSLTGDDSAGYAYMIVAQVDINVRV